VGVFGVLVVEVKVGRPVGGPAYVQGLVGADLLVEGGAGVNGVRSILRDHQRHSLAVVVARIGQQAAAVGAAQAAAVAAPVERIAGVVILPADPVAVFPVLAEDDGLVAAGRLGF